MRLGYLVVAVLCCSVGSEALERHATAVTIDGPAFIVNGKPTYSGRTWRGRKIEGLLLNARMVQATFDDLNPETRPRWAYPDTGRWDPERNVREFMAALPEWRRHGLLAVTLNLQGGSPQGYSKTQPWENSAFENDGGLRANSMDRLGRVLDLADELGMVVIVGYFYFGQDQRLQDEAAVVRATDEATRFLLAGGWTNVLVEVDNECDQAYDHEVLKPGRVAELIARVKAARQDGRRLLVSTSYGGNKVPDPSVVTASDFVLLHGNGVKDPARIAEMVREARRVPTYSPKPVLFNEDDHFDFDVPLNNFTAAVQEYAGWGFFDYRMRDEGYAEGFQSVPVDWRIGSRRKRGFFRLLAEITGSVGPFCAE
jgi:hypothetical protein